MNATFRGRSARGVAVALLIALSIPIGLYALLLQGRLAGDPAFHERIFSTPPFGTLHVVFGGLVLMIGGFQFVASIRRNHPVWHRWLGRIYLAGVALSGSGGLVLAFRTEAGYVATFGFALLALLWLGTAARAYASIRAQRVREHQRWMIRNFALTFAAVTLRIELGLLGALLGTSVQEGLAITAWISWVPPLLIAEWWLLPRYAPATGLAAK